MQWRAAGERLLLCMDVNESVVSRKFVEKLAKEGVDLEEVAQQYWDAGEAPSTFVDGSNPIDGILKTPELESCIAPAP